MKKVFLAFTILISFTTAAMATVNNPVNSHTVLAMRPRGIPQPCVDSYNLMYPGATTIKWSRKGETRYQVVFIYEGVKMTASYAPDGTYLGK